MRNQRNNKNQNQKDDRSIKINERIGSDCLEKLKLASKQLKDAEILEKSKAREKAVQEKINKEKNKSFEELLDESSLDWKSFK
ncbi:YqkE family protein [Bacillaceae bacterium IKA-2]|jgi:hypothetical protein|nr:YqkE family protein [Bacillaceae bacterium IKA-2]